MQILILGGTGMLGHKMYQTLAGHFGNVIVTLRETLASEGLRNIQLFRREDVASGIDVTDLDGMSQLFCERRPTVVINCIGVIKQRDKVKSAAGCIRINALLPHVLADLCSEKGARLIHFSTDCVFNGKRGNYKETDFPDAEDLYGKTKSLGEITDRQNCLTLRTSMIGRELFHHRSLLEWFLAQRHSRVRGFCGARYSGLTTNYLAGVVRDLIERFPDLSGLYQVSSGSISKYELLTLIRDRFKLDIEIEPDHEFFCDRSLSGDKFHDATGYVCPSWPELIDELAADSTPYDLWRTTA